MKVSLIIPALNEEESLPRLLAAVPPSAVDEIIVVDNGSSDRTAAVARQAGARVISEDARGYGAACWAGFKATDAEILVFMDGDGSFSPAEISRLTTPIIQGDADLVLGSRTLKREDAQAIPFHARLGNRLITGIIGLTSHIWTTDLGPFRAIRREVLEQLKMEEKTYGWPSEMIIKSAKLGYRLLEVSVGYWPRTGGKSKVSGNFLGSLKASCAMLKVVARWSLWSPNQS
ncbi:MAG TPA: glycosyltransferase family 2 protein [Candidatus Binatia bacterium]|nr:glycosyltransferase family 2 protein [Candidatus Binatia bacterium]